MQRNNAILRKSPAKQRGQSMVEYTVVTVFGILFMTTGPMRPVIEDLADIIRDNYDGYSYAISLSDIPEKENPVDLITLYNSQNMPVDQVSYLVDYPEDLLNDIVDYTRSTFPSVDEAFNLLDDVGLSVDDFLDGLNPLSLF